jgi:hypothetical protein
MEVVMADQPDEIFDAHVAEEMSKEIAKIGVVELSIPGVEITDTELRMPDNIAWDDYTRLAHFIDPVSDAWQWWAADYVAKGEQVFSQLYPQAITLFKKIQPSTLKSYASVSRKVPPSRRRNDLTFSHHRAVTKLKAAEQRQMLKRAAEGNWSAKELAKQVNGGGESGPTTRELLHAAVHTLWVTSKKGPVEADEDQYAVDAEFLRKVAQLNGDLPMDSEYEGDEAPAEEDEF